MRLRGLWRVVFGGKVPVSLYFLKRTSVRICLTMQAIKRHQYTSDTTLANSAPGTGSQ